VREFASFVSPKVVDIGLYYAWDGDALVLLLYGGNKSTQSSDIAKAREFWRDYHGQ
jgi:putative addiction module killer protein